MSFKANSKFLAKVVGYVLLGVAAAAALNGALALISSSSNVGVVAGVVLLALLAGGGILMGRRLSKYLMLALVLALPLSGCGTEMVKPGWVGIRVNFYGKNKGVSPTPLTPGRQWWVPFTAEVIEYPTFVQTAVWTRNREEGRGVNEEIAFNSKEGLVLSGDISLSFDIDPALAPAFYAKFRTDDIDDFTHGFMRNIARDAFNEVGSTFSVDEIYGLKKGEVLDSVKQRVNRAVNPYGVKVAQFGYVGELRLPAKVVEALNAKITATQDAMRIENELRSSQANAQKVIAAAEGQAKANEILTASINDRLLRLKELEVLQKWNGQLPTTVLGGGASTLFQLTK